MTFSRAAWVFVGLLFAIHLITGILPVGVALSQLFLDPGRGLDVLAEASLWRGFLTSTWIACATLMVAMPLGIFQAWLFTCTDLPARRLLLSFAPLPLFLPPLAHVLSWFEIFDLQGFRAIVLVYTISFTPLVTLMTARALEQMSRVQFETLRLLGGWLAVLRDQLRQALPAAAIGGALAVVFIFSDFAVADFLSSVGPKVTPYGESLYVYYQVGDRAAEAGAALPGLVLMWTLLAWALRRRRELGAAVDAHYEPAPPLTLGRARIPMMLLALLLVGAGAAFPLAALAWKAGSVNLIVEQARLAEDRIAFTAIAGVLTATVMVFLGLPFAVLATRARRPWRVDLFVLLPLGVPALLTGVGLIHTWNQRFLEVLCPSYYELFYEGMGIIVVALAGRYLAFAYLCCGGAVERLEPGLFETARLGGANSLQRAVRVLVPLCTSALIAAWCFSFCFSLRELDTLQVLSAGQETLPYWLYMNIIFKRDDEVAALALLLCLLTCLPLLLSILFARRSMRFL